MTLRLRFVGRLFGRCKLLEIAMESTVNGEAFKWTQSCSDALCAELESVDAMIRGKESTELSEIQIYQIAIDDVDVASLKERAVVMKWAVDIIKEAQNKKEQHYIGSSIPIQRM